MKTWLEVGKVTGKSRETPFLTYCGQFCVSPSKYLTRRYQSLAHAINCMAIVPLSHRLVGWLEFNALFQHKYGYIRDDAKPQRQNAHSLICNLTRWIYQAKLGITQSWHDTKPPNCNINAPMHNDFIRRMYCPDTEKNDPKLNKLCIF